MIIKFKLVLHFETGSYLMKIIKLHLNEETSDFWFQLDVEVLDVFQVLTHSYGHQ